MFCKNCGSPLKERSQFCINCGVKVEQVNNYENTSGISEVKYSTFGRRAFAFVFDYFVVIGSVLYLLNFIIKDIIYNNYALLIVYFVYFTVVPLLLDGATLGQKLVKIKLCNLDESKVTWLQLFIRSIIVVIFNIILFPIAFLSAIVLEYTPKKQSLYDKLLKTSVIRTK